jgi:hypothetical protein
MGPIVQPLRDTEELAQGLLSEDRILILRAKASSVAVRPDTDQDEAKISPA